MLVPQTFSVAQKQLGRQPKVYKDAKRVVASEWDPEKDWTGPTLSKGAPTEQIARQKANIARTFSARALLGECIEGHVDAVVGREPDWSFVPDVADGEDTSDALVLQADELEMDTIIWWDEEGLHDTLSTTVTEAVLGRESAMRIRFDLKQVESADDEDPDRTAAEAAKVTSEDLQNFGAIEAESTEEAFARIHVEMIPADSVYFGRDDNTKRPYSVVQYETETETGSKNTEIEVCYIDENDLTHLIVLRDGHEEVVRTEEGIELGGRLLHVRMKCRALVNESLLRQQADWNRGATMENMNIEYAGFRQRDWGNAMPPGEWKTDSTSITGRVWVPDAAGLGSGPGVVNFVQGHVTRDADGSDVYGRPELFVTEPVSNETLKGVMDRAEEATFSMMHQRHRLISGDATASGESRIQAREEFAISLFKTTKGATKALRELLGTALFLVSIATGNDVMKGLRVSVKMLVYSGALTGEERTVLNDRASKGLVSMTTYLTQMGEDDPEAELERMQRDQMFMLDANLKRMELMRGYFDAGFTAVEAAILAGVDEGIVEKLRLGITNAEQ